LEEQEAGDESDPRPHDVAKSDSSDHSSHHVIRALPNSSFIFRYSVSPLFPPMSYNGY